MITKEKLAEDVVVYAKEIDIFPSSPNLLDFFRSVPYSAYELVKLDVMWSDIIKLAGLKRIWNGKVKRQPRPYRQKGLDKVETVDTICQCGRKFKSPVDHKGVKTTFYCTSCHQRWMESRGGVDD